MTSNERDRESLQFTTWGNIVRILGDQLITSEEIALTELIKNSYDADATIVEIKFLYNPPAIIVRDNGSGMTIDAIKNGWGKIGISKKKVESKSPIHGRSLLGDKGVGRFASQKLGNILEINTKTKNSKTIINVKINWNEFKPESALSTIGFPITKKQNSFPFKTGTEIIISDLSSNWDKNKIKQLNNGLQSLLHPADKELELFNIKISAESYPNIDQDITKIEDILELVPYKIEGFVNFESNTIEYNFIFKDQTKFEKESSKVVPISYSKRIIKNTKCGNFSFQIWGWETKRKIMKKFGIESSDLAILEWLSGVRVYRNGFRVFPYGNRDNDWLRLDTRRYRRLSYYLSNKQLLGLFSISKEGNPELTDKTDREGIVDCEEMRLFTDICIQIISQLESERLPIYENKMKPLEDDSEKLTKGLKKVSDDIEKISKSEIITKKQIKKINRDVKKIAKRMDNYYTNLVEPLYIQASITTIFSIPLHEIKDFIEKIDSNITKIISNQKDVSNQNIIKEIIRIQEYVKYIKNIISSTNVILRGKRLEKISIKYILDYVLVLYKEELDNAGIQIIDNVNDLYFWARKNQLVSVFMNIINNAIYWVKTLQNKSPKIKIVSIVKEKTFLIIFSDNGPGFIDPPEVLISPFFTRKPDGMGLGLYLTDILMKRLKGSLIFNLKKHKKHLLEGASVGLEFRREGMK
ncbi:MAG: GHKL domain-containing protein [Candidatus Heimdallarchaeota archaeon]|nr:GHKL domain-containing protein [Candidatus Heimdallarchaeota archaeon]